MARVLIVEDDAVIGLDLADQLQDAGHHVIGVATNNRQALALVRDDTAQVAVLDVNLGNGTTSEPVARALIERSVPFVTVSGYSSDQHPDVFRSAPLMVKPVDAVKLSRLLEALAKPA